MCHGVPDQLRREVGSFVAVNAISIVTRFLGAICYWHAYQLDVVGAAPKRYPAEGVGRIRMLSSRLSTNQRGLVPFTHIFNKYRYITCRHGEDVAYQCMIFLVSAQWTGVCCMLAFPPWRRQLERMRSIRENGSRSSARRTKS